MSENSNSNKSNRYWCNVFNMSKKQRNKMLQTEREQGYWAFGDHHPEHKGVFFNVYGAEKQDGTRSEKWLTADEFEQRKEQLKSNSRAASKARPKTPQGSKSNPTGVKQMTWPVMPIKTNIDRWQALYDMVGSCVLKYCPIWIQCHLKLES